MDLWGGFTDKTKTTPWGRDTLVNVFSTTKGLTACAHRLVDQGKLDLDAPVAKYWPEFAQAGKQELPVRYLLSHRAGLPAVRKPLPTEALFSWEAMTASARSGEALLQTEKGEARVPLTRDFKETIRERVQRDPKFRKELLREGLEAILSGEIAGS